VLAVVTADDGTGALDGDGASVDRYNWIMV